MSIDVRIKGLQKFQRGLQSLPVNVARRILAAALKDGANHLTNITQGTAEFQDRTGALRRSIKSKVKKISDVEYQAMVMAGDNTAWYARLVEYGGRYVIKGKRNKVGLVRIVATGRIGPKPFMRNAFDSERFKIMQLISDKIGKGVAREFKKLGTSG